MNTENNDLGQQHLRPQSAETPENADAQVSAAPSGYAILFFLCLPLIRLVRLLDFVWTDTLSLPRLIKRPEAYEFKPFLVPDRGFKSVLGADYPNSEYSKFLRFVRELGFRNNTSQTRTEIQ